MKKITDKDLLFSEVIATNTVARSKFLSIMEINQAFWGELTVMCEEYIYGIERSIGFALRPEERTERHDAFMMCAAYLFAGLHSSNKLDTQKIPDIPQDLIKELRCKCDSGEVLLERHNLLSSPGGANEIWAANFAKLVSAKNLNVQGSGLLYALAIAWITTEENDAAQAECRQDAAERAKTSQSKSPKLWGELDKILEASGFGEESQSGGF